MAVLIGMMHSFNQRLRYGTDSLGNYCGTNIGKDSQMDLSSKKYLFRFDFSNSLSYKRCLESCPESMSLICKYGVEPNNSSDLVKVNIANPHIEGSADKFRRLRSKYS